MSAPKLTLWFDGDVQPARIGVYERRTSQDESPTFQHWNGHEWLWCADNPSLAARVKRMGRSTLQSEVKWRGFAADPKGKP